MSHVNYNQLTELTGMTFRTIKKRFTAAGLRPVAVSEANANLWDSAEALPAIYAPLAAAAEGLDPSQEKARLDKLRADHQQMVNDEKAGNLAPCEVTGRIIADIAVNCRNKLMALPSKIGAILPAEHRVGCAKEIDRLVREVLADLASYEPKIDERN